MGRPAVPNHLGRCLFRPMPVAFIHRAGLEAWRLGGVRAMRFGRVTTEGVGAPELATMPPPDLLNTALSLALRTMVHILSFPCGRHTFPCEMMS